MPKIPGSSSGRIGIGSSLAQGASIPSIPDSLGRGGFPGSSAATDGADKLADVAAAFANAKRESELMTTKADALLELKNLQTSVMTEQDPDVMLNNWAQGATETRQKFVAKLGDDEKNLGRFDAYMTERMAEMNPSVNHAARTRTIDLGKAGLQSSLNTLAGTLEQAKGPQDFLSVQTQGESFVQSARDSGFLSALEAENLRSEFSSRIRKAQESWGHEERLNGAYSTLYKQFGGNGNAAVQYLDKPENRAALNLSWEESNTLLAKLDEKARRDKRRLDEARAEGERSEKEAYYRALEKNDMDLAGAILAKARNIPGAERRQMRQAVQKDQWDDDPRVASETQRAVWEGRITDASQITPLIGNGLSLKSARTLRDDLDKINKDAPPFAGAMNYFSGALDRFELVSKDAPGLAEQKNKFAATLTYEARKQGIGPFDPRMDKLADSLLQVVDKPWYAVFGKDKTKFQQSFEEGNLPGLDEAPQRKIPAAPAPAAAQQIPQSEYEAVKRALAEAGKDTSDATVRMVWQANRGKLGGGK